MEYMNWRGNPQGYCTICGKRIVSRAKLPPKYCSKCAKKIKLEQTNQCKKRSRKKTII